MVAQCSGGQSCNIITSWHSLTLSVSFSLTVLCLLHGMLSSILSYNVASLDIQMYSMQELTHVSAMVWKLVVHFSSACGRVACLTYQCMCCPCVGAGPSQVSQYQMQYRGCGSHGAHGQNQHGATSQPAPMTGRRRFFRCMDAWVGNGC